MVIDLKPKKDISQAKTLSLRLLKKSDCKNVCRWLESSYILQYSFVVSSKKSLPRDFSTKEYAQRYFDMILSDPKRVTWALIFNDEHIGNIGLKEIDQQEQKAECFIEIGDKQNRGIGLGQNAMSQLLNLAYFHYGLNEVELDVLEFNFAAIKVYRRLGFVSTGFSSWHYDEYGQYWRVLRMNSVKNRWLLKC